MSKNLEISTKAEGSFGSLTIIVGDDPWTNEQYKVGRYGWSKQDLVVTDHFGRVVANMSIGFGDSSSPEVRMRFEDAKHVVLSENGCVLFEKNIEKKQREYIVSRGAYCAIVAPYKIG